MLDANSFCVTLLDKVHVALNQEGGKQLRVYLDDLAHGKLVQNYTQLIEARGGQKFSWLAGGGCYILEHQWVPLVRRSECSPVNPGLYTIPSGRSDSIEELYRPALIIRELFEEIVLITETGELIVPVIDVQTIGWEQQPYESVWNEIRERLERAGVGVRGTRRLAAGIHSFMCRDRIEVFSGNKLQSSTRTMAHINQESRDINVLFPVFLNLGGIDPRTLNFLDTETMFHDGRHVPLNREIYLYNVITHALFDPRAGTETRLENLSRYMTPHAEFLLSQLTLAAGGTVP